jgi:CRP-like cAMP-binding protein
MALVMARDLPESTAASAPSGKHTMRALLTHSKSPYRLPGPAVDALVAGAQVTDWRAGRPLLSPDEQSDLVHFLVHGAMRIEVHAGSGRWSIAAFVPPGRFVSSLLPLPPGGCRFGAITHTSALIATVSRSTLRRVVEMLPLDRALGFMAHDADQLRRLLADRCSLVWASLPKRLTHALCRLARDFGEASEEWTRINLQITQADLARFVGASRANVSRTLGSLQRTGEIAIRSRRILVRTTNGAGDLGRGVVS